MPPKLTGRPLSAVAPATTPAAAAPFRAPVTIGRVIYFVVVMAALTFGAWWLYHWLAYVTATGVVERDLDKLAPRERGRITRVAVAVGDRVKRGQPLVWLDFVGTRDGNGATFLSDAAVRAQQQRAQLEALRERQQELAERRASTTAIIAGLWSTDAQLEPARRELEAQKATAERLVAAGAATQAEAALVDVKLAEIAEKQTTARNTAREQERALQAIAREEAQLQKGLAEALRTPAPTGDPSVVVAPRDGVVAWVAHRPGEVVGPDDSIVYLTDGDAVRVRAFIAPRDAGYMVPGRAAEIRLPSGESLRGEVRQLHLLASLLPDDNSATQLGRPTQPTLTGSPQPPVDPNGAFLLADVTVLDVDATVGARLAVGAPVEVRVARDWPWTRHAPSPSKSQSETARR